MAALAAAAMQDALDSAITKDTAGQRVEAVKLYRTGLTAIEEGLALVVPSPGLDPAHSNVAKWRSEMKTWQQQVQDRWVPSDENE